ncbi:DNA polymerase-1 [Crossiella equi]|uniref:DNA polymerase-1 n=1 Tax=Crossiella equi TaxID=130796 RepID=A0ABS5AM07_9PSEU|nr:hypothetical protein [Crossiella equi]MBP2477590.1 DNA polymerase-1 [Crossiella equi]
MSTMSNPEHQPTTGATVLELAVSAAGAGPRADGEAVDVGLEAADVNGHLQCTITPLDPQGDPYSLAILESSENAPAPAVSGADIRWVAHNLADLGAALGRSGMFLRTGLCLDFAQAVLDAVDGAVPPLLREHGSLRHRYEQVVRALAVPREGARVAQLVALGSGCAVLAAELEAVGVSWNSATFEAVMANIAGKPVQGSHYPLLDQLAHELTTAWGARTFTWAVGQPELCDGEGYPVLSGKIRGFLGTVSAAQSAKFLQYRHLKALAENFGYEWAAPWRADGRWRPQLWPARSSTEGWRGQGGAVQLPHVLRECVQASPGRILIRALVPQAEPRMWAHLSHDPDLLQALACGDLYRGVARRLSCHRDEAALAVLTVLHDNKQVANRKWRNMMVARFPTAVQYLSTATAAGHNKQMLRSPWGLPFPEPNAVLAEALGTPAPERSREMIQAVKSRGRQARRFVIQSALAEFLGWAAVQLRSCLTDYDARLVLLNHGEFLIEANPVRAEEVESVVVRVLDEAVAEVLGESPVAWSPSIGRGYTWAEAEDNATLR